MHYTHRIHAPPPHTHTHIHTHTHLIGIERQGLKMYLFAYDAYGLSTGRTRRRAISEARQVEGRILIITVETYVGLLYTIGPVGLVYIQEFKHAYTLTHYTHTNDNL